MKKLNLLFTALLLLFSLTATAHEFEVDGIYYNILSEEDKTVEVTYRGTSYSQYSNEYYDNVVIPESVIYNGSTYNITSIGSSAFYGCPDLTSIEIPNSVTSIGASAFYNCTGITNFEIPNSVTSIGGSAFYNTTWYNNLPNGVVYIGKVLYKYKGTMPANTSVVIKDGTLSITSYAFSDYYNLTSIVIPNSVTSIGNYAFENCKNLTNIEIPNSVTSIGERAFYYCSGLTNVTIGNSVTSIGASAFYNCTALTSIVIPDGVTSIGDNAFYNTAWYNNLSDGVVYAGKVLYKYKGKMPANTSIVVKDGTLSIASYAFKDCSRLKSIEIPNSVTSIGKDAFYNCYELTVIVIPNSVTSIYGSAFKGCSELKTVINFSNLTFSKGSSYNGYIAYYANKVINAPNGYIDEDYVWYEKDNENILAGYIGSATELTLPTDYKGKKYAIGTYAFRDCTSLTSIVIPNSVTSIGTNAFNGCTSLKDLRIEDGEGILSLGNYYVFANCPLETLYLGRNLSSLLFHDTPTLTSVTIGDSVTSIGESAFYRCYGLTSIVIPNSVTSIGREAFRGCTNLTSIEIPNSVTSIGTAAFEDCTSLTSIEIPNSVTSIGDYAFRGCKNLKTVINFSNLTFSKGSSYDGYIAYYANKVINAPNGYIDGDYVWYGKDNENVLAGYIGDTIDFTLPANCNGENYVIGERVFYGNTTITNIEIPSSVTSIGDYAFYYCTGLTSVTIGNSVTSIGEYAFWGCSGLKSIEIPNSVTSIGYSAFRGCTGLTSITIPNSVTSIGSYAFYYCNNLKTVINFSNLTFKYSGDNGYVADYADKVINAPNGYIDGDYVWYEKDNENVLAGYTGDTIDFTLPTNCNGENYAIDANAFKGDTIITSIVIPNSVTSIGASAFYDCTSLKDLRIEDGEGILSLGNYAFGCPLETLYLGRNHSCEGWIFGSDNKTLTSVTIGDNVTSIGEKAFSDCSGLTSIVIPNSVTSIGNSAFESCTGLTSIVIGDGVTSIGSSAFSYCRGLTSIVIGDGVTSIGASAFNRCTGLTSVVIPNSVTSIGAAAFSDCSSLTSVVIGDNVTSIGNSAFWRCSGLTSIEIPNSVTSIESDAFAACTNLTAVHIRDVATWCNIDFNDYSANPLYYAHDLYLNGEKVTDLVIPDNVTSIGYMAFINCTSLTSIVIPNSVTSIGEYAFWGCSGLKTVINLSNLTFSKESSNNGYIVYYANKVYNSPEGFIENGVLLGKINGVNTLVAYFGNDTELTLPADYKGEDYVIGEEAFSGKTTLTSIEIPNSVTSIGNYAFKGCTGLKEVHINDLSAWCGINFGSNDANPLYYARNLYLNGEMVTDLEIPDGVTSIENYAFINCSGLTNVVVSDGIDVIGESAFSGCSNVETVYISNTIYSIGNNAFAGCNKIYDIKVGAKKPIGGNENIFASTVYDNATLYIPGGTKSLYEKREPWNRFFYIKEMDFTGIDELKGEDVKLKGVCYDLSGRAVENPSNGIYIIDGKKVMVK